MGSEMCIRDRHYYYGHRKRIFCGGSVSRLSDFGVCFTFQDGISYCGAVPSGLVQQSEWLTHYWVGMAILACSVGTSDYSCFSALAANISATPNPSRDAVTE